MPSHKVANEFIRKYNKEFAIKGYSKMKIHDKLKLIEEFWINNNFKISDKEVQKIVNN